MNKLFTGKKLKMRIMRLPIKILVKKVKIQYIET